MISTLLSSEWIEFPLKGLILFVLGGACAMLARRSSAAVRHGIWTLTLGSALTLPILSVCVPSVSVPVLPAGMLRTAASEHWPAARPAAGERSHAAASHAGCPRHVPVDASTAGSGRLLPKHGAWALRAFVLLWSCGTVCFAAKLFANAWRADRAARRRRPLPGIGWTLLIHTLAERAKITASIRVGVSPGVSTPITWGVRRPVVLLPLGARDWSDDRRSTVLLHEFAHIQRRDHIWNLLGFLSLGLHWLNPLAWHAHRQMTIERERAADDWVLRAGMEGCDYASHLLALVRDLPRLRLAPWPTSTMANGAGLRCRLHSLLDDRIPRGPLSTRILLTMIPVAVALLGTLAPMHLSPSHAQERIITSPEKVSASRGSQSSRAHVLTPYHARSVVSASEVPTTTLRSDTEKRSETSESATTSEPSTTSSMLWRIPPLRSWLGRRGEPREERSSLIPPLESVIGGRTTADEEEASLLPPLIWATTALARDRGKAPAEPAAAAPPTKAKSVDERRGSLIRRLAPAAWRLGALGRPGVGQTSATSHEREADDDPTRCPEKTH